MKRFARVILPVPVNNTFTYSVPEAMRPSLTTGMRVIVPFGAQKFVTGIVESFTDDEPQEFKVKDIGFILDSAPVLRNSQARLWQWVADYYLCAPGDVMRAALPAGLKVESETNVEVNPDVEANEAAACLTERELFIWQHIFHAGKIALATLAKETGIRNIGPITDRMIEKGVIIVSEKLVERFRPKKEQFVRIRFARDDDDARRAAFADVGRSQRQEKALIALIGLSGFMNKGQNIAEVSRKDLAEASGASASTIKALADKGIIEIYTREVSRFRSTTAQTNPLPVLNDAQTAALDAIHRTFAEKRVTLLHGVTGSGKTEIYMHLADFVMRDNKQVLFLVPEIALTTQLTRRLQVVFGRHVIVYHSRFSDAQRVEIWQRLRNHDEPCIVIGARSSVFLPFSKLGLVIVDEEHEASYKQFDPAPRYNGRDVGIMLAQMHGACALLGSATPSVETYYKATTGKYGLVKLTERFGDASMPEIRLVDMCRARKYMNTIGAFARETITASREAIRDGRQIIFFQNRRGYAPVIRCPHCGFTPKCKNCDVSLTLHKSFNRLECHYCGATYPVPDICPQCGEPGMCEIGYGTERIEDDIADLFPDARLLRMDLDSTRNKDDYARIIDDFSQGKADILIGTQMVTKGLDFNNVSTVAVLDADALIHYPDYRSTERAFNMIEQVGGRAGRKFSDGRVLVQSQNLDHPVLQFAANHDYAGYYRYELEERAKYCYPPFSRIIYIYLKHRDPRILENVAALYAEWLTKLLGNRVLGPQEPVIARVQNQYIRRIMLKIEPQASLSRVKEVLRQHYIDMHRRIDMRNVTLYYDVDPI